MVPTTEANYENPKVGDVVELFQDEDTFIVTKAEPEYESEESAALSAESSQKKVLHFFLGDFNKRTNLHRSATA